MLENLTKRQREVFEFIVKFTRENGFQPSFREIGTNLGIKSTRAVSDHINALKRKGVLDSDPCKARAFTLKKKAYENLFETVRNGIKHLSLRAGYASMGAFSTLNDTVEETYAFDENLVHGHNTFLVRAKGDSMINAHIQDGDLVLVNPDMKSPKNGEIIVARLEDEATVKRYFRENGKLIRLQPENDELDPIFINEKTGNFEIIGKVVGVFRQM